MNKKLPLRNQELARRYIHTTSMYFGVSIDDMMSASRLREVSEARKVLYYLLYYKCGNTYSHIAKFFNRHHSTVIVALRNISPELMKDIDEIKKLLGTGDKR